MSYNSNINLFHILFVTGLLVVLAFDKFPKDYKKPFLLVLASGVFLYHYYLFIIKTNCPPKDTELDIKIKSINSDEQDTIESKKHIINMIDTEPGLSDVELTVSKGDTVTWKNKGKDVQTVTSYDVDKNTLDKLPEPNGEFHSDLLKHGDSYSVQFNTLGRFLYYSIPNKEWMKAVITVV